MTSVISVDLKGKQVRQPKGTHNCPFLAWRSCVQVSHSSALLVYDYRFVFHAQNHTTIDYR